MYEEQLSQNQYDLYDPSTVHVWDDQDHYSHYTEFHTQPNQYEFYDPSTVPDLMGHVHHPTSDTFNLNSFNQFVGPAMQSTSLSTNDNCTELNSFNQFVGPAIKSTSLSTYDNCTELTPLTPVSSIQTDTFDEPQPAFSQTHQAPSSNSSNDGNNGNVVKDLKSNPKQVIRCDPCGRVFKYIGNLTQHNNAHHSDEYTHKCVKCGKRFRSDGELTVHYLKHNGKRAFGCEDCGKRFHHAGDLRRHCRRHTENLFFCSSCGKGFVRKTHKEAHEVIHDEVRKNKMEAQRKLRLMAKYNKVVSADF